ncbi:hypothetical protein AMAG_05870 [Allomyces macrogynus ATCC 38327]|uniref:Eukaryotic membrane protein family-domain-containing protein n=1 Tax=Allomyces macrogynus (strain ATCC 38327) TaxID=578462 RepID=A0A0L0SDI2_ALLM3|nr:hypothetical protein AMAG_05870 [Allomyces macrogynus ATCC 38327]|eukprot:KNE60487.1 hypothetical protein AMAG_05870 [Allomyces macrogynus ATCC 38327]
MSGPTPIPAAIASTAQSDRVDPFAIPPRINKYSPTENTQVWHSPLLRSSLPQRVDLASADTDHGSANVSTVPRVSVATYLRALLFGADVPQGAAQKSQRISNFFHVPFELEKTIWLGYLICLDSFLWIFTILPFRAFLAVRSLIRVPWTGRWEVHPNHRMDLWRVLILGLACLTLYQIDINVMYHGVRGQSMMKFYVLFNLLEVFDKLCCSFGLDILDSLFARSLETSDDVRRIPFIVHFFLAAVYVVVHAVVFLYQMVTLNASINSHNNALLSLLISNQFGEVKQAVFKRFEPENFYQLTCSDMVERMNLTVFLGLNVLRNYLELANNTDSGPAWTVPVPYVWWTGGAQWVAHAADAVWVEATHLDAASVAADPGRRLTRAWWALIGKLRAGAPVTSFGFHWETVAWTAPTWVGLIAQVVQPAVLMMASEVMVDWLKASFITKFNNLKPEELYRRYRHVLCAEVARSVTVTDAASSESLTTSSAESVVPAPLVFEPRIDVSPPEHDAASHDTPTRSASPDRASSATPTPRARGRSSSVSLPRRTPSLPSRTARSLSRQRSAASTPRPRSRSRTPSATPIATPLPAPAPTPTLARRGPRVPRWCMTNDHVPLVSRRLGFGALALAALMLRMGADVVAAMDALWGIREAMVVPIMPSLVAWGEVVRVAVQKEGMSELLGRATGWISPRVLDVSMRAVTWFGGAVIAGLERYLLVVVVAVVVYAVLFSLKVLLGVTLLDVCLRTQLPAILHADDPKDAAAAAEAAAEDRLARIDRYMLVKSRIP